MFNIFKDKNELMTEEENIRFLLNQLYFPYIEKSIEAFKAMITTESEGRITLITAKNYISTSVSKFPD